MASRTQRANALVLAVSGVVFVGSGLVACGQDDESSATGSGNSRSGATARLVFFDDFEYDVARSATDAELQFRAHGWTDAKANNSYFDRGAGYLYTRVDLLRNSRVLVMESLPSTAYDPPNFPNRQTDYWLKYGAENAPLTTVPANVWFQFWTYATPESRFDSSKFIYPCRGPYPCTTERFAWLFGWHNVTGTEDNLIEAPAGGRFWLLRAPLATNRAVPEWNQDKLYQNLNPIPLLAGRWYQVRIHVDTSRAQGIYEVWIRERGNPWIKVSEWIGGVTPSFEWPISTAERVGNRVVAMPTTVNEEDSIVYLDDFAMATGEAALPTSP
ncbi:MAG: hypothetical protein NNA31_01690 [Nitrospira sp.]|nr:hypothetical protein [Nitrospira sp.]